MFVQTAARRVTLRPTLVSVLVVLTLGCAAPGLQGGQRAQPTFLPPEPGPQGVVEVYSERYVLYEKTVPLFRRRPVDLLTPTGYFLRRYENPVGDGLVRLEVPVGLYLVASEVRWVQRAVRVEVQEGRPVVVSETQLEQAPPLATVLRAG
jgi:hypothetical protein